MRNAVTCVFTALAVLAGSGSALAEATGDGRNVADRTAVTDQPTIQDPTKTVHSTSAERSPVDSRSPASDQTPTAGQAVGGDQTTIAEQPTDAEQATSADDTGIAAPSTGVAPARAAPSPTPTPAPSLTWQDLPSYVLRDEVAFARYPAGLGRSGRWKPAAAFVLATGSLVAVDPSAARYFRRTTTYYGFDSVFSGTNTALATAAAPLGAYVIGLATHDARLKDTSLRGLEAFVSASVLNGALKSLTRRERPSDVPPAGDFSDTWFEKKSGLLSVNSSFPSGHTMAAFAVATVFAERSHKKWVKITAYGLAATIGFSRLTLQSHFPSDVFAGAVLGWAVGHRAARSRQ